MKLPQYVLDILNLLSSNAYRAYLVGGCVRDTLMNIKPNDYDIASSGKLEDLKKLFLQNNYTVRTLNESFHKTIIVAKVGNKVDISEFKNHASSILEDLMHRDFTINAIAYDYQANQYIDPFEGQKDIDNKLVQCVGNPINRFKEDPLRILRLIRFSAKYKFLIEPATLSAAKLLAPMLESIVPERVRDEAIKIMQYEPSMFLFMHDQGILQYVFRDVDSEFKIPQHSPWHYTDVGHHTMDALMYSVKHAVVSEHDSYILRFALLFHDTGKILTRVTDKNGIDHFYRHAEQSYKLTLKALRHYHFPSEDINEITKLVRYHHINLYPTRGCLFKIVSEYNMSLSEFILFGFMYEADISAHVAKTNDKRITVYQKLLTIYKQKVASDNLTKETDLKISGNEIMNIFHLAPGKAVGDIKHDLFKLCFIAPSMNTHDNLVDYLKKLAAKQGGQK